MFSEKDISETLNHDSEHIINDNLFDIICDANQPQEILYEDLESKLKGFI